MSRYRSGGDEVLARYRFTPHICPDILFPLSNPCKVIFSLWPWPRILLIQHAAMTERICPWPMETPELKAIAVVDRNSASVISSNIFEIPVHPEEFTVLLRFTLHP
jgi:hypothetical protein